MVEKKNLMTRVARPGSEKPDFGKSFHQSTEKPKKQLTIKLDEELHRKLKTYASQNGTTITDLISEYIRKI